jgi:hypothetical protein
MLITLFGPAMKAATPAMKAAIPACPGRLTLVDTFELSGMSWAACEDLQKHGGALSLVSSTGRTEWFNKGYELFGSAPTGNDDNYYLNYTKAEAVGSPHDVLALGLLSSDVTWERVAGTVPPIRHAGTRTFVGSRGSVADTTFNDAGEDAAGYGFPPALSYVFNLTNIAQGGAPILDGAQYINSSLMAEGLVGDWLPIVVFYFPVVPTSPYLPKNARGSRYWTMVASAAPDMHGSREQTVWFRFQQVECAAASGGKQPRSTPLGCQLVGAPQYWDTYWWSRAPGNSTTSTYGPTAAASASGFYASLLANRAWWERELTLEGMMDLSLPSPRSTNGTQLAMQMRHNIARGMITWHDTWGPRYGVLP